MPDVNTIRDMARKLGRWRDSLPEDERDEVTRWMRAGVPPDRERWWFEPGAGPDDAGPRRSER